MAQKTITLAQLGPELAQHGERVVEAVGRGVFIGAQGGRSLLTKATPSDQGQMRNAWKVSRVGGLGRGRAPDVELINEAPHAGIVERGARPHKVSPDGWAAIYAWVVRHRALFGYTTKSGATRPHRPTRGNIRTRTDVDPVLASITWGIVKKIEREGQKPTYFVRNNLPLVTELVQHEVENQLRNVAQGRR